MFSALRHRNFRLFISGQLVSLVGTWMQTIAQSWLVYELTRSSFWLGLVGFLGSAPLLVLAIFGGAIADRWPKRELLIITQIVAMFQALTFAVLVWQEWISLAWIGALALSLGIVTAFEWPARQSFVIDLVGKEDLANGIALHSVVFNSARLLGPAFGGVLIALVGTAWCFFLNGLSFLGVIAGILAMRLPRRISGGGAPASLRKSLLESLSYVRGTPPVLALLALVATMTIFGWSLSVLLPVFASEVLRGSAVTFGNLMSAMGIGALLSALGVAAMGGRVTPRRLSFAGLAIFVIAVSLFALSENLSLSMGLLVLVGFGQITFYINANTALQRRVPDHLRGRAMGIYAVAFGGLMPIGSLQAGAMAHAIGVKWTVLIGSTVCTAVAYAVSRILPASRPRPLATTTEAEKGSAPAPGRTQALNSGF